jgi:hypothetical protein
MTALGENPLAVAIARIVVVMETGIGAVYRADAVVGAVPSVV